jgi:phage terminase large subunit-like protein
MSVQVGPAAGRNGPRSRPRGVGQRAIWDDERLCWTSGEFWFDETAAQSAVDFFPRFLRFTSGEWASRPFTLEDWQQDDIVRPLFGWKRADGTRRYRRCFVWVPRKNGKTELAAGIALLLLLGDAEEGGEVYSIATDKDQAAIVFNKAAAMVGKSPALQESLLTLKTAIYCSELNASFKPLAGSPKGKHGLAPHGVIGDEVHEWNDGELYQFVHDGEGNRRQPLEFLISTAGKKGGYGEEVWNECEKIVDGTLDDPETLVVIYAADETDDWQDEATWYKANPNLGVSKKLSAMRTDARRARQSPRLENSFKAYHLDIWSEQAVRWLPIDSADDDGRRFGWRYCAGPVGWKELETKLIGKRCFSGGDLSSIADLTSLVHFFPVQDGLEKPHVLARFFKPELLIQAHAKRDKLPYDRWVDEGALIATPGNVVDYAFFKSTLFADAERFEIVNIGMDRFNATQTVIEIQQAGLPVEFFQQGFLSMSPPSKELERLIISNGLFHGNHPILSRHARVVAVETDPAGNIKPTKARSAERIDGIVGLVEAIGVASKDEGAGHKLTSDMIVARGGLL